MCILRSWGQSDFYHSFLMHFCFFKYTGSLKMKIGKRASSFLREQFFLYNVQNSIQLTAYEQL